MTAHLIVLGSANRDLTVVVERHPVPGETVLGGTVSEGVGGKGANQAAAAARSGVTPVLVGAVGRDAAGENIMTDLAAVGVDVSFLQRAPQTTGMALITVSRDGENTIVVSPGANASVEGGWASGIVEQLAEKATVLLAQLEIPVEAVEEAALAFEKRSGRLVLNLSPATEVSPRLLALADPLVVNETEASELAGSRIESPRDAEEVAARLLEGSRSVVITLGGDGVVVASAEGIQSLPAMRVPVVDTTGAGDAFAGALAAALATGHDLVAATRAGIQAGADAVGYVGAQPPAKHRG